MPDPPITSVGGFLEAVTALRDHDTQKRGPASFDRDNSDVGASGVEFRLQRP